MLWKLLTIVAVICTLHYDSSLWAGVTIIMILESGGSSYKKPVKKSVYKANLRRTS